MRSTVQGTHTLVGMAYGASALAALERPGILDYIEVPFEQLRHLPDAIAFTQHVPAILHCASMSIGGFVDPEPDIVDSVIEHVALTATPWVGEHLAFMSAAPIEPGAHPTSLHYTVCPQLSNESLDRVVDNIAKLQARLPVPLILENPPQYFEMPGSTMDLVSFICALTERSDVGLLLDLSHLTIASQNMGFDLNDALDALPLERVVEIHLSGIGEGAGAVWDDHAKLASPRTFGLLERALGRARPRAVTLEYNWGTNFDIGDIEQHLQRVREALSAVTQPVA
jgi:uncharacterized protein (UPF0276 family)